MKLKENTLLFCQDTSSTQTFEQQNSWVPSAEKGERVCEQTKALAVNQFYV